MGGIRPLALFVDFLFHITMPPRASVTVALGTTFEDLSDTRTCPTCVPDKDAFDKVD